MNPGSRLIYFALGLLLLFSLFICNSLSQGYDIGAAINSTRSYVDKVNQSAYLVFYPNLTAAYGYINDAANVSHTNPAYAYALLGKAMSSAEQQLNLINRYRTESFYTLAAVSIILAILLNRLMKPKVRR